MAGGPPVRETFRIESFAFSRRDPVEREKNPTWAGFNTTLLAGKKRILVTGNWPCESYENIMPGMTFSALLADKPFADGKPAKQATVIEPSSRLGVIVVQNMNQNIHSGEPASTKAKHHRLSLRSRTMGVAAVCGILPSKSG